MFWTGQEITDRKSWPYNRYNELYSIQPFAIAARSMRNTAVLIPKGGAYGQLMALLGWRVGFLCSLVGLPGSINKESGPAMLERWFSD